MFFSITYLWPNHTMIVPPDCTWRPCDVALLLTTKLNRDSECNMRKYVVLIFYLDIKLFLFHSITYKPTTTWLLSQPTGWMWRHHGFNSAANNNNTQGQWMHGKEMEIYDFLLCFYDLIFSNQILTHQLDMIHIAGPRLNMEAPPSSFPHEQQ
jgi:hypothetical protein